MSSQICNSSTSNTKEKNNYRIPANGTLCTCGNNDPVKWRHLRQRDENNTLMGKFCKKCHKEWLIPKYTNSLQTDATDSEDSSILVENVPIQPKVCTAFQDGGSCTRIHNETSAETLKVGDHIFWNRWYVIIHHAIVIEVNADEIRVIHWGKKRESVLEICNWKQIREDNLKMNEDNNSVQDPMYRMDYSSEIEQLNPPELVLARARSLKNDPDEVYRPWNHCEHFATYCKTGRKNSHQNPWLRCSLIKTCCISLGKSALEVVIAETIEYLVTLITEVEGSIGFVGRQAIGVCVLVAIELYLGYCDISEYENSRINGRISYRAFLTKKIRRICEGIGFSVGAIGLGVLASVLCGGSGLGLFVVGCGAGFLGGVLGRLGGTLIGDILGKWKASKYVDYKAIVDINDLEKGDHIILSNKTQACTDCHAIVIEIKVKKKSKNRRDGNIFVIRYAHGEGMVKEWIPFQKPIYKVIYDRKTVSKTEAVKNAYIKLQANEYKPYGDSCELFATECKFGDEADSDNGGDNGPSTDLIEHIEQMSQMASVLAQV